VSTGNSPRRRQGAADRHRLAGAAPVAPFLHMTGRHEWGHVLLHRPPMHLASPDEGCCAKP